MTPTYHSQTGNLQSLTSPDGITLSYTYDGSLPISTTVNGSVQGTIMRTYDNDFRITSRSCTIMRTYDNDFRITSRSVNNVQTITYSYDQDSLLTRAGALAISRNPSNGLMTGTTIGNITTTRSHNRFGEVLTATASYGSNDIFTSHTLETNWVESLNLKRP